MLNGKKIWVTGHRGMVGSALLRSLREDGIEPLVRTSKQLDLTDKRAVIDFVSYHRPYYVFHIAAKVGGIYANSSLAGESLYNNLMIEANVIDSAMNFGVEKLMFVATNCIYPKETAQPIPETAMFSGRLEENVHYYAISKIAGVALCQAYNKQYGCNFFSIMPPNLYGPNDNYHPHHSHVVAGIMRRAHEAKINGDSELVVWGDGTARREILHVDDLARAMKLLMNSELIHDMFNIGSGQDISIAELAAMIAEVVGFKGRIVYDQTKPNGTMRKLLDSSRINAMGWKPKIDEISGLKSAYKNFLEESK